MFESINKNLIADETVLYRTKKHFIIFLVPFFWTLLALFFLANANPFIVKISYGLLLLSSLAWLNQFLLYSASEFAITNKRVMMREGFFYRHTNETRLSAIANVGVNQSLLAQAFNYGTLFINTFGGETDKFTEINAPMEFQKKLQELLYSL
ncbi:MAG: hypothetical protein K0R24_1314 [Gammaproteobacteria bacterium]|jgi:uncharacterized membrane protein YdbT with pleckstrin-like domain|nr:hypothetical protein [Gammaproteobacteria bacterium]MCE3238333.1 hypothetical protein [Gammaproteobacteria bacterium]